jgi:hypothetical protein
MDLNHNIKDDIKFIIEKFKDLDEENKFIVTNKLLKITNKSKEIVEEVHDLKMFVIDPTDVEVCYNENCNLKEQRMLKIFMPFMIMWWINND